MSVDITIQETVNEVDITVNQNVITVNVTRTTGGGGVESINGETGVVVLTTDNVAEGSTNLYFTVARVRATVLTGISFVSGIAITATDTILSAFGKLQKQISSLGAVAFSNDYNDLDNKPTIPTPQNLTQVLAIDNKTNDIPIVSNNGNGYAYVNDEQTVIGNDFGGTKKITMNEDSFALESTVRIDIEGKGVNMNTTTDGFLMPRVTTSQMNAIDVLLLSEGLLVYNVTESKFYQYNGTVWVAFGSGTVTSVSGDTVDNTDPLNPIINTPSFAETLAEDNKTNDIPIVSNNGKAAVDVNDAYTSLSYETQVFAMGYTGVQLYSEVPVTFDSTVSTDFNTPVLKYNTEEVATQPYADAKVADNLTASTTVAPSKTAVNTALDLKAPIAEPTFSGLVTSVGTAQTGSSATGVLNLSQTWNTTGNPTALKLNVTNTASSASSLLFDFQVNGVSMGRLTKTGILTVGNGINAGSGAVQGSFFGSSGSVFNFGINYMYGASGTATAATSGSKSVFLTDISWSPTSGTSDLNIFNASPTINQTGGANGKVRGFYFNPTLTAAADAIAIDVQKGRLLFSATNTASGTTGNQTINKIAGTVNFGAGASSLVVTNNLVTANSIVIPCVYGSDATASSARITPAAGSFTINLNAAATAETTVAFFVIN